MSRLALIAACVLVVSCAEQTERPTPPDLSGLVANYDAPSGTVTAESAQQVISGAARTLGLIEDPSALFGLVDDLFAAFTGNKSEGQALRVADGLAAREQALNVGGVEVDAGAWMVYRRPCPRANGAGAFGDLELTALTDIDGFRPEVWGRAADCRFIGEDAQTPGSLLDGDIALHIDWVEGGIGRVILRITGAISLNGNRLDGEFSVAWQTIEDVTEIVTTHVLPDGSTFLIGYAGGRILIEGQNGRFGCDQTGCEGPGGGFSW